jgi:hypothetical protein
MNLNLQEKQKSSQVPNSKTQLSKKTVWKLWHKLKKIVAKWEYKKKYGFITQKTTI